jgi:long-chain acyl-CoA synthetase
MIQLVSTGKHRLAGKSFTEVARNEKTQELISGYIDALNLELNRWEQIKAFTIVDRELSIEDLTPSMKLRRKVVIEKFADRLSALYEQ